MKLVVWAIVENPWGRGEYVSLQESASGADTAPRIFNSHFHTVTV